MKTREQEEYIAGLISKYKRKKLKYEPKKFTTTDYMRNCIYWIDEYEADRADIGRLKSVIDALQIHLNDIKTKHSI